MESAPNCLLWDYSALAGRDFLRRLAHKRGNAVDDLAPVRRDNNDRHSPSGARMIFRNTDICCHKDIESLALGGAQQFAVFQRTPRHVHNGSNIVAGKGVAKLDRQALVDQDAQLTLRI